MNTYTKAIEDFNGDQEAYNKYLLELRNKQKSEIEEKIKYLKENQSAAEKTAEVETEIETLNVIKRSLSDLTKDSNHESDNDLLMKQLDANYLNSLSEAQRQRELIKLKIARRQAKLEGYNDVARWIMDTETNTGDLNKTEKARQLEKAKKRLEYLKQRGKQGPLDSINEEYEVSNVSDFEEKVAILISKSHVDELQHITAVIETAKYKDFSSKSTEELSANLASCNDLDRAINLRLAIFMKKNVEQPEAEFVEQVVQQQKNIEKQTLENFNGKDILTEIENNKTAATEYVAYGKGTTEEIEKELKS